MRIKQGFVLREVAGQYVVIATGEASENFYGMIKLNQTGRDIWQGVTAGLSSREIAKQLAEKYGVDEQKALADTDALIARMDAEGFLVP